MLFAVMALMSVTQMEDETGLLLRRDVSRARQEEVFAHPDCVPRHVSRVPSFVTRRQPLVEDGGVYELLSGSRSSHPNPNRAAVPPARRAPSLSRWRDAQCLKFDHCGASHLISAGVLFTSSPAPVLRLSCLVDRSSATTRAAETRRELRSEFYRVIPYREVRGSADGHMRPAERFSGKFSGRNGGPALEGPPFDTIAPRAMCICKTGSTDARAKSDRNPTFPRRGPATATYGETLPHSFAALDTANTWRRRRSSVAPSHIADRMEGERGSKVRFEWVPERHKLHLDWPANLLLGADR